MSYRPNKFITKGAADVVGTPNGLIDAALEVQTIDVRDLTNVALVIEQVADAGTVVIAVEKSSDGITWVAVGAALTEASFPAGANTTVEVSLSNASGMPLPVQQVRARATALAGGGTYRLRASGYQLPEYR